MWEKEPLIVLVIKGGSIPNDLECYSEKLDISCNVGTSHKSVLLGIPDILRKTLSIKQ